MKLFNDKMVLFSQRMDYVESHGEWRDTIDQRISLWIEELGGTPIGMPNALQNPKEWINCIRPEVIVLTGGNTVSSLLYEHGGEREATYARDITEQYLLEYAVRYRIPMIGICRGFQMINVYFGGTLQTCENHIATRHLVQLIEDGKTFEVNSFHGQAVMNENLSSKMKRIAISHDGIIESIVHKEYPILGVQWHPEREATLQTVDISLIQYLLEGKL